MKKDCCWRYIGADMRLDYGEIYNVTVTEDQLGGFGVIVHTGIFRKVKKNYRTKRDMEREWIRRVNPNGTSS